MVIKVRRQSRNWEGVIMQSSQYANELVIKRESTGARPESMYGVQKYNSVFNLGTRLRWVVNFTLPAALPSQGTEDTTVWTPKPHPIWVSS
jgi:hypothetical protein